MPKADCEEYQIQDAVSSYPPPFTHNKKDFSFDTADEARTVVEAIDPVQ